MISRERIEQARKEASYTYAGNYWQMLLKDVLTALDEREELLQRIINPYNHDLIRAQIMGEIRDLLIGGRYEVKP